MAEAFISYAREDKDFVERLHLALRQKSRETWIDWEGILPSAEWRQEIFTAIEAAHAVLLVISRHSVSSKICKDELAHAVKNRKRIIPLVREEVDEALLPAPIKERHWIFLRERDDFEAGISTLISALDTDLDWVRAHTRLLTRAIECQKHKGDSSFALRGSDLRRAEAFLTRVGGCEPSLLPIQIEYILASRRLANRRFALATGAGALAVILLVIFGLHFWEKRKESALSLAANFREMGISELERNNPLAAELLFARALLISDNVRARERLIEARARSPRLLWTSPTLADSTMLAVSADGVLFSTATTLDIAIWSAVERRRVRVFRTRVGSHDHARLAAFGPNHRLFAIGAANKVEIWDLQSTSEQPFKSVTVPYDVSSIEFSVDGSWLIVGGENGTILVWDMNTQNQAASKQLQGHSDKITGAAISSDNRIVVSASWDETAKVWHLQHGTEEQTFAGHDDALLCVAISFDGSMVASAGWDDTIWIWNPSTGRRIRALSGHKGSILSLAFSPDGKWLVSGSEDRTARLWDIERGRHLLTFPGHTTDVTVVAFLNADGRRQVLTGDALGTVRLWDISTIGQRDELMTLRGHGGAVTMVAFSPIMPLLASSSVDKSINVWDLRTAGIVKTIKYGGSAVSGIAISPDGKYLASANKSSSVRLWSTGSDEFRALPGAEPSERIRHVAFSPDGQLLAGGSEEGRIRIWSVKDGSILESFLAHTAKIQGLEFNPEGTVLASSSEDSTVKLWQVRDWKLQSTLIGHRSGVYEVAFSPDARFILTGSDDKTARLWDVGSGQEVIKPMKHDSPVWAVGFAPDGKTIATGGQDSTLRLWDLAVVGNAVNLQSRVELRISDGPVWWIKFVETSDGISLGIGSQDKTARLLNISRVKTLFSNPSKLESEAQEQGGLVIGEAPGGEPQIFSVPLEHVTKETPPRDELRPTSELLTSVQARRLAQGVGY